MKKLIHLTTLLLITSTIFISCKKNSPKQETTTTKIENIPTFSNKGHELVYHFVKKVGDYPILKSKNDVIYTYTYTTPDGKTDVSTEKYLFEGELSYGAYTQHERTLPELKGTIEQGYDGSEFWLKQNGTLISDSTALKRVTFNRPTNFYWFAMFQKLLDPGLYHDYLGEKTIENTTYDVVKISFESTEEKPTDIYQIYINKETGFVDQFLFTVVDAGLVDTPLLMQIEYTEIEGIQIPTKRKYKLSTWDAKVSQEPWILVNWSNIAFNNGLTKADFLK